MIVPDLSSPSMLPRKQRWLLLVRILACLLMLFKFDVRCVHTYRLCSMSIACVFLPLRTTQQHGQLSSSRSSAACLNLQPLGRHAASCLRYMDALTDASVHEAPLHAQHNSCSRQFIILITLTISHWPLHFQSNGQPW